MLALPAAAAAAPEFRFGVTAGEVKSSSAKVWASVTEAASLDAQVATDAGFANIVAEKAVAATAEHDFTAQTKVSGLNPGKRYRYRFCIDGTDTCSDVGRFQTAPKPGDSAKVRFAYTGDTDAATAMGETDPFFGPFDVFDQMLAEDNAFNIHIGDTIYSDSEVPGLPPALTTEEKWGKYKLNLGQPPLVALRGATGFYSQWDDHEFINDFSRPEFGQALYQAGVKAFTDYAPVTWSARNGLYRTFRWGKNLELFFLDERSFRSAKASAGGICNVAGMPDLAPTAPAAVRAAFATLIPPLAQPVPKACSDAINSPARTFLGARQHAAFVKSIRASTATWKVVVNETPIQQFYQLPYDRWEGYAAERTQLLHDLAGIRNVLFLTTDTHANLIGEVRLQTLEPGGPVGTGIWEAVTGPVATNTYAKEIDRAVGQRGTGDFVTSLFLKPAPPRGIGMLCAATDVDSYVEVRVTATTLTVTPKDAAGAPVHEKTGGRCGPLVLQS